MQNTVASKLKQQISDQEKKNLERAASEIFQLSKNIKENRQKVNMGCGLSEKDTNRLIYNICDKVDFSYKSLKDSLAELLGLQQQQDISFLYLWSTINDVIYLRIKISGDEWIILTSEEESKHIDPQIKKRQLIDTEENEENKNRPASFLKLINSDKSITSLLRDNLTDLILLVLFYQSSEPLLYKFRKCRAKRNKLLLTHKNYKTESSYVKYEDIISMKEILETLLLIK